MCTPPCVLSIVLPAFLANSTRRARAFMKIDFRLKLRECIDRRFCVARRIARFAESGLTSSTKLSLHHVHPFYLERVRLSASAHIEVYDLPSVRQRSFTPTFR